MNRYVSLLRSSVRAIRAIRPMQIDSLPDFEPEEGYVDRAKQFFEFEQPTQDVFRTDHLSTTRQGSIKAAFGGLIFSQALAAAENTVDSQLKPHAVHSFFILAVDTTIPVEYRVRRLRDGRSFCTRTVEAVQNEKTVFSMQVSFHALEGDSIVHQSEMPSVPHHSELFGLNNAVPDLTDKISRGELVVPTAVERRLRSYDARAHRTNGDLFEIRPTDLGKHFNYAGDNSTSYSYWFRTRGDMCTGEKLHRSLVAYNTDSTLAGSVFRPHFNQGFDPSMIFSLDHCVWFHQHDFRADKWMLFEHKSDIAGRGRGLAQGRVWSEDGTLLMTCSQEVLVRSRGEVSNL